MRDTPETRTLQNIIELESEGQELAFSLRRHRPGWDVWGKGIILIPGKNAGFGQTNRGVSEMNMGHDPVCRGRIVHCGGSQ